MGLLAALTFPSGEDEMVIDGTGLSEIDLREGNRCCGGSGCAVRFVPSGITSDGSAGGVDVSSGADAIISVTRSPALCRIGISGRGDIVIGRGRTWR